MLEFIGTLVIGTLVVMAVGIIIDKILVACVGRERAAEIWKIASKVARIGQLVVDVVSLFSRRRAA